MGLLDDIIAGIDAEADDKKKGGTEPGTQEATPKPEDKQDGQEADGKDGWYGNEFKDTYLNSGQES